MSFLNPKRDFDPPRYPYHHFRRTDEYVYVSFLAKVVGKLIKLLIFFLPVIALFGGILGLILWSRDGSPWSVTASVNPTPVPSFKDVLFNNQLFNSWQNDFLSWVRPRILFAAPFVFFGAILMRRLLPVRKKVGRDIAWGVVLAVVIVLFGPTAWNWAQDNVPQLAQHFWR